MVSVVLDNLASGYRLEPDDIKACLTYAAELAKDRIVPFPAGTA